MIRGRHLTGFGVAPDGEAVAIHLMDEESRLATLLLPAVGHWEVAGSPAQGGVIVTLETPDGFQVSFSLAALELLKMATQGASRCMAATGIIGN